MVFVKLERKGLGDLVSFRDLLDGALLRGLPSGFWNFPRMESFHLGGKNYATT